MTANDFLRNLLQVAPNLATEIGSKSLYTGTCMVCEALELPYPAYDSDIDRALDQIWQHIVDTGWRERPQQLSHEEFLAVFSGQLAALAARGKFLTSVLTRQIECLAENRTQEIVQELEQHERDSVGWSTW